jgi:hypothetical protein
MPALTVDPLADSLATFLVTRRFLVERPLNGTWTEVFVDCKASLRERVCQAVRKAMPKAWIIVEPQDDDDRFAPRSVDALAPTARCKATSPGWPDPTPDLLVTDKLHPTLGVVAAAIWFLPMLVGEAPKPSWAARLTSWWRRQFYCGRKLHRVEEVNASAMILKVCKDCGRQVGYRSRSVSSQ